jgi:site-specific DNA-methyltransferase (cytosine-N4-specific)
MTSPVIIGRATLYCGGAREVMCELPSDHFDCSVFSPPYWGGLRNYGDDRQLGMERDPADYVAALVATCRELRRTLHPNGTLWLNIADAYAASGKGGGGNRGGRKAWETIAGRTGFRAAPKGFKPKDLVLVSFMVAEALRIDGWYLRKTIIWRKPAAIEPERLDRPSLSHEYIFMLSKSQHYAARNPGGAWWHHSVWDIRPGGYPGHPAAFPVELAQRCILAATEPGGRVLDPFGGAGTTAVAAAQAGREVTLIELNKDEYWPLLCKRIEDAQRQGSLFDTEAA